MQSNDWKVEIGKLLIVPDGQKTLIGLIDREIFPCILQNGNDVTHFEFFCHASQKKLTLLKT